MASPTSGVCTWTAGAGGEFQWAEEPHVLLMVFFRAFQQGVSIVEMLDSHQQNYMDFQ